MKIKNILRFSLFLLPAYCNLGQAFGLNDAIVTSSLGEPLIAQINITDVEKSPDISCFSITDANSPPAFTKASLAIKHQASGYQLTIKSPQAITEPIINLRVVHHCEPNIHRDYVVLLDPPLLNDTNARGVDAKDADAKTEPTQAANNTNMPASALYAANGTINKKKKKSPKTASSSSLDKKLTATYTGQPQAADKSGNQVEVKSRPYLSISGGHPPSGQLLPSGQDLTLPKLGLKLETRLNLSRAENTLPPSSTDVIDEITAMDNRLALLKTQIISLQDKNEKLEADAANAEKKLQESTKTLRITAGLIALFALLASAAWLRRQLVHARKVKSALSWFDNRDSADATDNVTDTATTPAGDTRNAGFNDAFDESPGFDIASGFSTQPANAALATSINGNHEDILESVDVLIEYGRSGLAIHLLQDHLDDHPSESPKIWLKLLSLIAAHGSETDYTQTVAECSRYYRIHMPGFAEARKTGTATIEDFPYITKELETAWGSAAAVELLDDLIYNSESQPEEGFEPEIFEQLFMLRQIAETLNNTPTATDETAKPAAVNTNGGNPKPGNTESPAAPSQAVAGFMTGPMMNVYETTAEELPANWYDALPQTTPSAQAFPTLDFASETTQYPPAETTNADTAPEAAAQAGFETSDQLPEAKRILEAPEIDFSQHIKAAADTQESTATVTDGKQPKRIVKDSNLIDWVLTDEN
ncbi:type IV pilus assembly protein FimV [Methylotenera sp. G11]|uniref:type IV pilus assembly protein FimV n=1 Tax=Methylotenera sp. G11 TaxID=1506585 RepID=UPI0006468BB4|nr:hypothetical protein [Methylotenera sp. G11]